MKRIFTFLLIVFAYLTASAESVSEQQALQKAQQFMKGKQLATSPYRARARGRLAKDTVAHGYYVFNTVESNGFVIIASDDRMPEVLGYSEHGSLDPATAPCNVKWLLEYYDKAAANIKQVGAKARAVRRASRPDVRPLITTTWDQGAPYNLMCPEYNGAQCITGCVATAMAQVINYNRWPVGDTKGVPAYTTGSNNIAVPALDPTRFDWDNMNNDDVARLMRYCGQSVKMDYGVDASGAMPSDEAPALIRIFGYSQTAHYAEHLNYSEDEWEDLLYNELAEQRPIVFNGFGNTGGHTFVVHGYRDGRFYINWGWSGNEDGYFYLTSLNTSTGDYSSDQTATIGIQPPAGADVSRPKVVVKYIGYSGEKYFFRNEANEFPFYVYGKLVSDLAEQKSLNVGLGLYDDGGLKKVLWEEKHDFPVGEEYDFGVSLSIGNDISDGEYRLVPISRDDENDTWRTDANSSDYYLTVTISGRYMKVLSYPLSSEERSITDLGVQTIDGITYNFYTQKGKNRASVLPSETGSYQGELYIPDMVPYQGNEFKVYKASYNTFQNCTDLTSLSTAMTNVPIIWGCKRLKTIELREGVMTLDQIGECHQLESLECPKSLTDIQSGVSGCQNFKTIRFNNVSQLYFGGFPQWSDNSLPNLTDVYFTHPDAPIIRWKEGIFQPHSKAIIHVPQGCKADFESGDWKYWNVVDDLPMTDAEGVEWGYCEGNDVANGGPFDTVGGNDVEYAIHVPAAMLEAYKGKTISSIQVFQSIAYDYVFITKPGTDYIVKQPAEGVIGSWLKVTLPEPYTITGEELYVGVGRKGSISMFFADEKSIEQDGLWFRVMGADNSQYEPGEWINIPEQDQSYAHPIPLRFVISGNDLPEDALLKDVTLTANSKTNYSISAKVINRSVNLLKKVTLEWDFDGKNKGSKTFDVDIRHAHSQIINFDVEVTLEGRNHDFNYAIVKINDVDDSVKANSTGTINFNTAANTYYPRRVVMEEATGTWCGWCVRGIETIDRLTKQYPDNFIAIALHNGDEMSNPENYGVIASKFNSYPGCIINRTHKMDPAYPDVKPLVEEMMEKAEAKVSATAVFAKRDYSAVTVNTESVFGFNDDKTANFRLAYAVVEDGVGPYVQSNYYSGETLDAKNEYMQEWTQKGAKVNIEFNDVARGIYGSAEGVDGSIPKIIKEGEIYNYSYTFLLPKKISNKDNLRIIVMLMDCSSGEIINACQTKITYDSTVESQIFSLSCDGKPILNGESVSFEAEIDVNSGITGDCGTNVEADKEGLVFKAYDNKVVEGSATLEIISDEMNPQQMTWSMGGTSESIVGKKVIDKTFKTRADGTLPIGLLARNMKSYGNLEANLTIKVGSQTESVKIILVNQKPVVGNVTVKSGQVWWCNHDTRNVSEGSVGSSQAEHYIAGIYIPFDLIGGKGTTIDGFSFRSSGASMANVSVWISTKLPDSEKDANLEMIKIPSKQLAQFGLHDVAFSQSYEIPESGLYVGYSFDITDPDVPGGSYPIFYTVSDKNRKGGLLLKSESNPKWTDLGTRYGNMYAKVLFGGDTFKRHNITTYDLPPVSVLKGGKIDTRMTLVNEGADIVEKVSIEVKNKDGSSSITEVNANIEPYSQIIIPFELKSENVIGASEKTLIITKINGQDNTSEGKTSAKIRMFTLEKTPIFTPVIETPSATWAWSSIRVPFVSKELESTFGDRIIQIYPHVDDVMAIPDYADVTDSLGLIRTYVNRGEEIDLYYGTDYREWGIKNYINNALTAVAPASINVRAEWVDEEKSMLDIHTEGVFDISFDNNPFRIGYVLIADGLKGTGSQWDQANQYALGNETFEDPFFQEMAVLPTWVSGLKYDNIPIAAWGAYKGVEGTLPDNIVAGEKNPFTYRVDISGNFLIQDKENLSVVVLLLDKKFGTIVNAAKYYLGEGKNNDDPTPQDEAKVFEFRYEGKALSNNSIVEIPAELDSSGFGELECMTNPSSNPKNGLVLATKDGKKLSGTATITISKNTLNPNVVQWCMGGECVPMNDRSSLTKNFTTDDEGVCQVMFDATNIKSEGVLEARLSATIGNETRIVNIKFIYDKTNGISVIYSEDDNAVWYDMNGTRLENAPTRKGIYIRNGHKVIRQ